jgi:NAD(P)-dependent dehydrogenase (short-subunit alcohol dehydrogenase family)
VKKCIYSVADRLESACYSKEMSPQFGFDTSAEEVADFYKDSIKNKVILTTGVSPNGIGAYYVQTIAAHSPKLLILAGRDANNTQQTADAIKAAHPNVQLRLLKLDLSDLEQVREAAKEVNLYEENIDILVNNAALMVRQYMTTKDGLEMLFGTNHIGPFVFSNLILPKVLASGRGARIINVSSAGHRTSPIRFEDWNFQKGQVFNKWKAYGQSKTANILFSVELARRFKSKGLESFSVHPGGVWTNLGRDLDKEKDFSGLSEPFGVG